MFLYVFKDQRSNETIRIEERNILDATKTVFNLYGDTFTMSAVDPIPYDLYDNEEDNRN